jgi:hypothetical protein
MPRLSYITPDDGPAYQPGVCNIGPAEIARRRMFGHLGLVFSVILLAVLLVAGTPHWTRLLLAFPVGGAATGYLQAALHFCAGFGSAGVYNFGPLGRVVAIEDASARSRDRRRSLEIALASLAIGLVVGIVAFFIPVG